ncbi:peptidoglycan-binding domain-containing protein [Methylobacterium tardum]|uniref:peptidoglycan-binding domain-containing protein n=1 Tax=Methylobacterium tardum TaxID=374432 RepID=UPI00360AB8C5
MGRPGLGDGVRFRPPSGGDASAQGVDQATRAAQNDLRDLGFDPGTIDGRWGPRSLAALRRFQRGEGLPESGRADPDTLARLRQRSRQPSAASPIAKAPEPDATARSPLPSVGVAQVPDPDARAKESPAPTSSAQDAIDSDSPDGHTGGRKPPRLRSPVKRRESPGPTRRTPPPSHDRKRRGLRASPRPPPSPSPRSRWSAPSYPAPCWPPGACAADAANWSRPRRRPSTPGLGTASRLHRPACRARHPWVCALHGRRPRTTSPSFPNRGRRWPTRAR